MKNRKQYPCGKCSINVGRCKSILCKSTCCKWYHFKCTSLTNEEFNKIYKGQVIWSCDSCKSCDVTLGIEQETKDLNADLSKEFETQNEIIKTLNDDLNQANEEIRELKSQKILLETLVLKKEESIILLEKKINELNAVIRKPVWQKLKSRTKDEQLSQSFPLLHSTPNCHSKKILSTSIMKHHIVHENVETSNRFEALAVSEEVVKKDEQNTSVHFKTSTASKKTKKKKMLICADSHGRDLAWHMNAVQGTHEAVGFVRPGGLTREVLGKRNIDQENLGEEDTLVVICGSNDVAKNEADKVIETLTETLDNVNTNVVLVDLPMRYDLAQWSCVNKEVTKTNKRLTELSESYPNVSVVRVSDAQRHLHTQHGQHLNQDGKRWLSNLISEKVASSSAVARRCLQRIDVQPPPPGTESLPENSTSPGQPSLVHRQQRTSMDP